MIRRSGVAIRGGQSIEEAAVIMERAGVGALAVVESGRLVGLVTDRDLVRRGLARGVAPDRPVAALMSTPVVSIDADLDVREAFALFRRTGGRRLPVVRNGAFVGMLTIDDLLINVAGELADLARPVTAEVVFGDHEPAPADSD
jgi:CBS domain-containing protein